MSTFDVADLVAVAARTLGLESGAALDLVDLEAAERALAEARRWRAGDPVEQGAAALLAGLVRHRPVAHGNRVVALVATLQFLALHGWDLDLDPPAAAADLLRGVAAGAVDQPMLESWIAARLRRCSVTHPKEEGMLRRLTRLGRGHLCLEPLGGLSPLYTERARRSVAHAEQQARALGHGWVGTEHLLLGLLVEGEGEGVAGQALQALGVSAAEVRARVEAALDQGPAAPARPPRARQAPARQAQAQAARPPAAGEAEPPRAEQVQPPAAGEAVPADTAQQAPPPAAGEVAPADAGQARLPFTPRAKKVLELALRESKRLGHGYIGTEHLLLALVREGQGLAAMVLTGLGADPARVHQQVTYLLSGRSPLAGAGAREQRSLLLEQMSAVFDQNERLLAEVARLHALLRQHGIEPDGSASRSA